MATLTEEPTRAPDGPDEDDLTPPKAPSWFSKYDRLVYGAIGLAAFLVVWWGVVA
ncbi:MAG: ABC transporter permease, partial [Rhodococcus sp.]|nr:ABC transporter permease [Rhodococcus sp. (in: high G+C Gram-positive bacteria)]